MKLVLGELAFGIGMVLFSQGAMAGLAVVPAPMIKASEVKVESGFRGADFACENKLSNKLKEQLAASGETVVVPKGVKKATIVLQPEPDQAFMESSEAYKNRLNRELVCRPSDAVKGRFVLATAGTVRPAGKRSAFGEWIDARLDAMTKDFSAEGCALSKRDRIESSLRDHDAGFSEFRTNAKIRFEMEDGSVREAFWFMVNNSYCARDSAKLIGQSVTEVLANIDPQSPLFRTVKTADFSRPLLKPIPKFEELRRSNPVHGEYIYKVRLPIGGAATESPEVAESPEESGN